MSKNKLKVIFSTVLVLLCFQSTTFAQTQGSYMQYPAMQNFINRMVKKGFDRNFLVGLFSNIQRDKDILAKVNSPAEAKPWYKYRPILSPINVPMRAFNSGIVISALYKPQANNTVYHQKLLLPSLA